MSEIDQLDLSNNDNLRRINQRKELEQLLLRLTDENTEQRQRLSAKKADKIVELISGEFIRENHHLDLISASIRPYEPHFPQEYWDLICKIFNLPLEWAKDFISRSKHRVFPDFTNQVIYSRFDGEVVKYIQLQNPYVAFAIRKYKLFQFLSKSGQDKLDDFIEEALNEMRVSNTNHEFRMKMLDKHKVAYQQPLF